MSWPATVTEPVTSGRAVAGSRPSSDAPSTLLPEPDSPTRATISPGAMSSDTPRRAFTAPSRACSVTFRSRTLATARGPLGSVGTTMASPFTSVVVIIVPPPS